jgi:hypothetical protein
MMPHWGCAVMRRLARLACVGGAVAVAATLMPSPARAVSPSAASTNAFVCSRGLDNPPCEQRPSALEFSDNHDLVATNMTWRGWGRPSAQAAADVTVNWTGTPATQRGDVRLYDLRTCHGQQAYRHARVSWPGESVTIRLDCRAIPGQARYVEFHSADKALGCGMIWDPTEGSSARCDVAGAAYTTPITADCRELDQGDSLILGETVASTCHGDTVLRAGRVLAVGHSKRVGDIRCTMTRAGVECRNLVSGHGFRMSRTAYRTW